MDKPRGWDDTDEAFLDSPDYFIGVARSALEQSDDTAAKRALEIINYYRDAVHTLTADARAKAARERIYRKRREKEKHADEMSAAAMYNYDTQPQRICPMCHDEGYSCVTCHNTGINPDWRVWMDVQKRLGVDEDIITNNPRGDR